MFCVIYRSIVNSIIEQPDIDDLLQKSRNFNHENDITGCLLYYNRQFIQYLEGDSDKVMTLFEKIKKDQRHKNVQLLFSGHIYDREFKDWTMAYENFLGANSRLKNIKSVVNSYFDKDNIDQRLSPMTKKFWSVVKSVLTTEPVKSLNK